MSENHSVQKELHEKISSLKGAQKKPSSTWDGKDVYFIKDEEFWYLAGPDVAYLKLNKAAKEKLNTALKAESRASVDKKNPDWIKLQFKDSLDLEFAFIYIRYVWKQLFLENS